MYFTPVPLLLQFPPRLLRRGRPPHLAERVQVEGQAVNPPPVVRLHVQTETVEAHEAAGQPPHPLVRRVEDVRTVLVHVDALYQAVMHAPARVRTPVYHQATLPRLPGMPREGRPEQARTHYQVIVVFLHTPKSYL